MTAGATMAGRDDTGIAHDIFLIDDDRVNLALLEGVLSKTLGPKCRIHLFSSGHDALAAVRRGTVPTIVVSDQRMPDMTGVELLEELHFAVDGAVAILLSGCTERGDLLDAINRVHPYRYLTKPWKADELVETIRGAMELHASRKAGAHRASDPAQHPSNAMPHARGTGATNPQELVDTVIDRRYRMLEILGRGSSGCVYRAAHLVLDREYAIKVLVADLEKHAKEWDRFRREARAISKLEHPNVVGIIDFGSTEDGLAFLVMELVRGRTLQALIDREAPLHALRAAHIARQIVDGLSAAHRAGFVHRDVKPGNVILGDGDAAKIVDFGAVRFRAHEDDAKLTREGHILGTPAYMAPEQFLSSDVGPKADLYAVGVMLYEMLTGDLPFTGTGPEMVMKHLQAAPLPLERHGGLGALAMRLLEKNPDARPRDARAVLEVLDALGNLETSDVASSDTGPTLASDTTHADAETNLSTDEGEPAWRSSNAGSFDARPMKRREPGGKRS